MAQSRATSAAASVTRAPSDEIRDVGTDQGIANLFRPPPSEGNDTSTKVGATQITEARRAARELALRTPASEVDALFTEHQDLVLKSLERRLTTTESLRHTMVRWHLARIQDAYQGAHLDALEQLVETNEFLAAQMSSTVERLAQLLDDETIARGNDGNDDK